MSENGDVTDTLTLPRVHEAARGRLRQDRLHVRVRRHVQLRRRHRQLGTYAPAESPGSGGYSAQKWLRFDRTPTTAPAWCGNWLMVKSTSAVCGVDLQGKRYFALSAENGADDYGEWLASEGQNDTVVTYSNIDYTPIGGEA